MSTRSKQPSSLGDPCPVPELVIESYKTLCEFRGSTGCTCPTRPCVLEKVIEGRPDTDPDDAVRWWGHGDTTSMSWYLSELWDYIGGLEGKLAMEKDRTEKLQQLYGDAMSKVGHLQSDLSNARAGGLEPASQQQQGEK